MGLRILDHNGTILAINEREVLYPEMGQGGASLSEKGNQDDAIE